MKHAWQYVLKAAKILHAQGQATFSPKQVLEQAEQLGWLKSSRTIRRHVCTHMRDDLAAATHPYLEYLGSATYRLNADGKRAAEGL